jgi:poly [ADP-ribose] polymerase
MKSYKLAVAPKFPTYEVIRRVTLNFTDIEKNNNKYYSGEIQLANTGQARIFTDYGRVGSTPTQEVRLCDSVAEAQKEFDKLVKSKIKKGYTEIKLVKADVGSDLGKQKVEQELVTANTLSNLKVKFNEIAKSKLHTEVQSLVRGWFGDTAMFIQRNLDTAKCPLGQLSLHQINLGKDILNQARTICTNKPDVQELNKLTSSYYTNIPHVLGHKINVDALRFDSNEKIDRALDILDVFSDAKNIEKVLGDKSSIDSQYESLKADIEYVEQDSPIYKWIDAMFHETRAANHKGLGKIKVLKVYKLHRRNEEKIFNTTMETIAKECGKFNPPQILAGFTKNRPDSDKDLLDFYSRSNTFPVWHGSRKANMVGITTRGLLIRPSGVAHAGSMFGDGVYWASNSTKAVNYTDAKGSVWAKGNADSAFLLLADCAFGNQRVAYRSHFFTKKELKTDHSVWAQAGQGLYNDEFIVYNPSGEQQQHRVRYVVEFATQVR